MRNLLPYIYYRLAKFYKNAFGIEESSVFFVYSCYSWGLLVLLASLYFYIISIETTILWLMKIKTNATFIIITMIPFAIFHIILERHDSKIKEKFKEIDNRCKNEKMSWLKGICVFLFVMLSLVSYIVVLHFCK